MFANTFAASILRTLAPVAIAVIYVSVPCLSDYALSDERHGHSKHSHREHSDHQGHKHEHKHSHHKKTRQHSAHEHGAANLNLVVEDKTIHVEILLPAVDVTGFGHRPKSPQEKRRESKAIEVLKSAEKIFALTKSAKCAAMPVDVTNTLGDTHGADDSEHSEYRAVYQFRCSVPQDLSEINLFLFKYFPSVTKIRTNTVVAGKQKHLILSEGQSSIAITK